MSEPQRFDVDAWQQYADELMRVVKSQQPQAVMLVFLTAEGNVSTASKVMSIHAEGASGALELMAETLHQTYGGDHVDIRPINPKLLN